METKKKQTTENFIKEIRRRTRRTFSSEQKITIVMEALRAETSVAELCRKYSIQEPQFYKWNKEFLEAGKKRLSGEPTRKATSDEVTELRKENQRLKEMVADLVLRYDIVKKLVRAGLTVKFNKYMRFTASEKQELINIVVGSQFGVNKTLREIGLNKSTFYNWYKAYSDHGVDGLAPSKRTSREGNGTAYHKSKKKSCGHTCVGFPHLSSGELAFKLAGRQQIFMSESSVYKF